ncbi:MAG: L-serine ammonia-lyase, iron-sulfur-dependent, subunit alpha [Patescibacteria group bacterium]
MSTNTGVISLFDIIGPVMIGPSSSHALGAAKIGFEACKLLKEKILHIDLTLINSFADTGKGHKTDLALLGGCLGINPGDEALRSAFEIANQQQISYRIDWQSNKIEYHPNTAIVNLTGETKKVTLVGYSVGGGRIEIAACEIVDTKNNQRLEENYCQFSAYKGGVTTRDTYLSWQSLINKLDNADDLIDQVVKTECQTKKISHEQANLQLEEIWLTMKSAAKKSFKDRSKSSSGLTGGDASLLTFNHRSLLSPVMHLSMVYGIGIAEYNAKMGKVVACPTAGSCGIVPGILIAIQEQLNMDDRLMKRALVIAGAIGLTTARQVELAGAVAGCQAEIGVAGAMAAAAAVYVLGGSLKQIENAACLVLSNLLGLTCDPIAGLVEVPCVTRNGATIAMVWGAIEMALSQIDYLIPYDEVVNVMKQVGEEMSVKYRETSQAGLAKTPTACQFCQRCFKL